MMNVWLITVGEPLPIDAGDVRIMRTGLLAKELDRQGHRVCWWTSTFDHMHKVNRFDRSCSVPLFERSRICLLHGPSYEKNVSFERLFNHYRIGREFSRLAQQEEIPDIILCSMPTLELCEAAVRFGQKNLVPVVLDVRDLWPDIFVDVVPDLFKPAMKLLLAPYRQMLRFSCQNAFGLFGITQPILSWGLGYAGRTADPERDHVFPLAYTEREPDPQQMEDAYVFWRQQGLHPQDDNVCLAFVGSIGRQFDLDSLVAPIRQFELTERRLRFVFCGDGEYLANLQKSLGNLSNVIITGRVGFPEIWTLLRLAAAGMLPYKGTVDFQMSVPNKVVEYLSAGLPVLSAVPGATETLLESHQCGVTYADEAQFVNACLDLVAQPNLWAERGMRGKNLFQRSFVAEQVYGSMVSLLERIALNGNR